MTLKNCQHNFCRECVKQLVVAAGEDATRCPICRATFSPTADVIELRFLRNSMAKLELKCPHKGCDEKVRYENFEAHKEECYWGTTPHLYNCRHCKKEIQAPLTKV